MDPEFRILAEKQRDQETNAILGLKKELSRIQAEVAKRQRALDIYNELLSTDVAGTVATVSVAGMGFREAIRALLRESDNGLTTTEIREQLLGNGYVYKLGTHISIRIGNEVRRMVQQGMMVKEGKKYLLTKKGWEME